MMKNHKTLPILLVVGPLLSLSTCVLDQDTLRDTLWDSHIDEGSKAYSEQDFEEAEKQYLAAIKEAEKFGPQDSRLITSLDSLASVYEAQRKWVEAEPLYQRTLALQENLLGLEHPEVADNLNNLAIVYKAQGKYSEAEPLYKRALAIREKANGPDHPDIADGLENLAMVYKTEGKYREAEALYTRELAIWENVLGPEHLKVATTLENYASLLRLMNRKDEADLLDARAKAILSKRDPESLRR
jgi:tetratricopeptide (TPR) repeat protein